MKRHQKNCITGPDQMGKELFWGRSSGLPLQILLAVCYAGRQPTQQVLRVQEDGERPSPFRSSPETTRTLLTIELRWLWSGFQQAIPDSQLRRRSKLERIELPR